MKQKLSTLSTRECQRAVSYIPSAVQQGLENIFFELLPHQIYGKLAHHLEFCLQSFLHTFGPQRPGFVGDRRAGLWALNTLCKIKKMPLKSSFFIRKTKYC